MIEDKSVSSKNYFRPLHCKLHTYRKKELFLTRTTFIVKKALSVLFRIALLYFQALSQNNVTLSAYELPILGYIIVRS